MLQWMLWMDADATYSSFTQDLYDAEKNEECRFAVYDVEYVESLDQTRITKNKIVFLMWLVIVHWRPGLRVISWLVVVRC